MNDAHTRYTEAELTRIFRDSFYDQGHTLEHLARTFGLSYDAVRRLRDRKDDAA